MPWVDVEEPHATEPRLRAVRPSTVWDVSTGDGWSEPDRGWAELSSVELSGGPLPDLTECVDLTISDSNISGIALGPSDLQRPGELSIEIFRSVLSGCDLSRATIRTITGCRIEGCKLTGTDLSTASVTDVVFERCALSLTNLRMAKLKRVQFVDCDLDQVDAYQLEASDVALPGSSLTELNLDGLRAERLDLREAKQLSFTVANSLNGCLVAEHQLAGLAHALAFAAGIGVERFAEDDEDSDDTGNDTDTGNDNDTDNDTGNDTDTENRGNG